MARNRSLTAEVLNLRIMRYRQKYELPACAEFPPHPDRDAIAQKREWNVLWKTRNRIGRYERGLCERCNAPRMTDSVFCDIDRAGNSARAGKHGVSLDRRRKMFDRQLGACAICKRKLTDMFSAHVDHNHKTGKIRGLLCQKCNHALGGAEYFLSNPDLDIESYLASEAH